MPEPQTRQSRHHVDDLSFLPPHEPTHVPGFHAYSHQLGVRGGDELDIRVSNDGPVTCTVVRYDGPTVNDATVIEVLPERDATLQPIHRGSYVYVEKGLEAVTRLTVEVWFRTIADAPLSGLIGQTGFWLALTDGNRPVFAVEDLNTKAAVHGPVLSLKAWHHLVGCFDHGRVQLFVDGRLVATAETTIPTIQGGGPLRLGALEDGDGRTCALFTGDLCGPGLYASVFSPRHIASRFRNKTLRRAPRCLGYWRFDGLHGRPYRDVSGNRRHGQPVNYPIRLIPGPRRTEDSDWSTYDPTRDPDFGHAVRFMADAVVDCRWPVTAAWRVPTDIRNGQYGVRATNARGETRLIHVIVRPRKRKSKLLCLSTTNTRIAYNFRPFDNLAFDYGAYHPHPRYPMMIGQLLGVRRPATGALWETVVVNFELAFYAWLNRHGIAYDLYTEWDLEANPRLLDHYTSVAWAGHSEYWTPTHYESLQRFVRRGGHLLAMSGNTAYWRVSLDRENGVVEVRKHSRVTMPGTPTPSTTCDPLVNAAHWHQIDHLPGATMREAGWPEASLVGVMTNGWTNPPLHGPRAGYHVLVPDHWAFHQPRPVDTAFPFAPDAAGYETDLSVRSMFQRYGEPAQPMYPARDGGPAPALASPFDAGLIVLARAALPGSVVLDYDNNWFEGEMVSEMVIWERPGCGMIFAAGSVLSSETLLQDKNFSTLMLNVIDRMGVG